MTRYHVSEDGNARRCAAKSAATCRINGFGDEPPVHGEFATREEANKFAEETTANFYTPEEVAKRLKPGSKLIEYGGDDLELWRRYGTSASISVEKYSANKVDINLHVYDGNDAKMDKLIGDTIEELQNKGFTGRQMDFKITAKYGQENIDAYDEMDEEEENPDERGGKYGIEVGHYGLYAHVYL